MLAGGVQAIIDVTGGLVTALASLLPYSPFRTLAFGLRDLQLLSWLAWVLPLDFMFISTTAWLTAMTQFYGLKFIMRKLNMIK